MRGAHMADPQFDLHILFWLLGALAAVTIAAYAFEFDSEVVLAAIAFGVLAAWVETTVRRKNDKS